ncbi:DMT family transporter [Adlercreutzia sp. ZJ154]|uniref:EamA family transporter n=1 Tax=Adlercreutzia sp. ZJ154 TaxID=2709790 RepID=UPI0013ED5855|nr:DMT family transporter [Adlercreutzia sp. ZJ154]
MENAQRKMWAGIAFTLLGGTLWGISGTSVQFLTTEGGAPPTLVTLMRVVLGGSLFFTFLLIRKRATVRAVFTSRRTIAGILLFAFSLYANQLCYAQTVQITNAGTATVLQMLGSVFVMLFVCTTTHKLPRVKEFIGLVIAIIATVLIATQGNIYVLSIDPAGLAWGIATGLSTAFYILVPKRFGLFEQFGSVVVVGLGMFLGTIFAIPIYAVQSAGAMNAVSVLSGFGAFEWLVFIVGLVIVGTIGGYGFYLHGVSIVGSVKGSLLGAIEPVSATIMAALWLGTAFTMYDIVGMLLMCIMVVFITTDE